MAGRRADLIEKLRHLYDADGTAFQIEEIAGGYQLLTRPAYQPWLLRLRRSSHELRLSTAAMETLAIVSYRQPIMHRSRVHSRRSVRRNSELAYGERIDQNRGPARFSGPAGLVWNHKALFAGIRPEFLEGASGSRAAQTPS